MRDRRESLKRTMDELRCRFGYYSIGRVVTISDRTLTNIDPKNDHTIHPVGYLKAV